MAEKEFHLLREPWIRVMGADCAVQEVSLTDALLHAHEYRALAGELPTQNVAVLRLLLAVLHAVFEREDVSGETAAIENVDDALDRWEALWKNGRFPEKPLRAYLDAQQDNFWLFHPTRPFWQIAEIPEIPNGAPPQSEPVQKLNGAVSESGNKLRLFSERSGEKKKELTNAEAARWLVCMNQYDDNAMKTGLKVALLGQFVAITAKGATLFETLMLNFVLLNQHGEPWEKIGPASWEQEIPFDTAVKTIAYPGDPVAILSYHARYGKLIRNGGCLDCYKSPKGGTCYEQISRNEQMAIFRKDAKKGEFYIITMGGLKGRQIWREFPSIIADKESLSGLVRWHNELVNGKCLHNEKPICYEVVGIEYDAAQHSSVVNIYSDSLSLHQNLLSDLGAVYRQLITNEIERCDKAAGFVGTLAKDLFLASGGDTEKTADPIQTAKERFYYAIDMPFREWLSTLDAEDGADERDSKCAAWRGTVDGIARKLAEKMVADAGRKAFIGKMVSVGKEQKKYYSSSLAMQKFQASLKKFMTGGEAHEH